MIPIVQKIGATATSAAPPSIVESTPSDSSSQLTSARPSSDQSEPTEAPVSSTQPVPTSQPHEERQPTDSALSDKGVTLAVENFFVLIFPSCLSDISRWIADMAQSYARKLAETKVLLSAREEKLIEMAHQLTLLTQTNTALQEKV